MSAAGGGGFLVAFRHGLIFGYYLFLSLRLSPLLNEHITLESIWTLPSYRSPLNIKWPVGMLGHTSKTQSLKYRALPFGRQVLKRQPFKPGVHVELSRWMRTSAG